MEVIETPLSFVLPFKRGKDATCNVKFFVNLAPPGTKFQICSPNPSPHAAEWMDGTDASQFRPVDSVLEFKVVLQSNTTTTVYNTNTSTDSTKNNPLPLATQDQNHGYRPYHANDKSDDKKTIFTVHVEFASGKRRPFMKIDVQDNFKQSGWTPWINTFGITHTPEKSEKTLIEDPKDKEIARLEEEVKQLQASLSYLESVLNPESNLIYMPTSSI